MAAPVYAIGQRLTADTLNTLAGYLPVTYTKAATTNRNTTTTHAADPELTGIPLAIGVYHIELTLFWIQATTNTQKIKTQWAFTGTWNTPVRAIIGTGTGNTASWDATTLTSFGGRTTATDATYNGLLGGQFLVAREVVYNVTVTVAGNLSLTWAQSASSANNTSVCSGTAFEIRKV